LRVPPSLTMEALDQGEDKERNALRLLLARQPVYADAISAGAPLDALSLHPMIERAARDGRLALIDIVNPLVHMVYPSDSADLVLLSDFRQPLPYVVPHKWADTVVPATQRAIHRNPQWYVERLADAMRDIDLTQPCGTGPGLLACLARIMPGYSVCVAAIGPPPDMAANAFVLAPRGVFASCSQ